MNKKVRVTSNRKRSPKKPARPPDIVFTTISAAQARESADRRKAELKLFDFSELDSLTYPGYFSAFLSYFATGEGMTRGIFMLNASNAEQLRGCLSEEWGWYFAQGCEVRAGLDPIPGYEDLVPKQVKAIRKWLQTHSGHGPGNFSFSAKLHMNYS